MAFAIWTANGPTLPDAPYQPAPGPPCLRRATLARSQSLQRQDGRVRQRRRLLEAHAFRDAARRHPPEPIRTRRMSRRRGWRDRRSLPPGRHRIDFSSTDSTWPATSHPSSGARRPQPQEKADEAGSWLQPVKVRPVDRCRPHPDQHLRLAGHSAPRRREPRRPPARRTCSAALPSRRHHIAASPILGFAGRDLVRIPVGWS